MILYSCNGLDSQLDQLTPEQLAGGPCSDGATASALESCRGQTIIAAWAIGGQVSTYCMFYRHHMTFIDSVYHVTMTPG